MSEIAEVWDAGSAVAGAAPAGGGGDYLEALRGEAGFVVGAIDWVVRATTGYDLIAAIIEPLTGDYAAVDSMRQGWTQVSVALAAVGDNHSGLAEQLPAVWAGAAEQSAAGALLDLSAVSARQSEAASLIADQLGHVLDVSVAAAELACAGLKLIDDVVAGMLLRLAAGPAGLAMNAAFAPAEAARIAAKVREIQRAINRVVEVVDLALDVVRTIKRVVDAAAVLAATIAVTGHYRAGARTDDTAAGGF